MPFQVDLDQCNDQRFLAGKVLVDIGDADAGCSTDLGDGRGVEAPFQETGTCTVEDARHALFAGLFVDGTAAWAFGNVHTRII